MKSILAITLMLLAGCASTWQPFSDDSYGQAMASAYESCMGRRLLQTKKAEMECLDAAKLRLRTEGTR